jgi:glycosyltransferase involved in cell wall biosynthesis
MRILHVVDTIDLKKGGVSQAVRTIALQLAGLGIVNEVVTLDVPDDYSETGYTIHGLGPSKGPWSYSKALVPWLMGNFNRFDTIIIHGLWLYQGFALRRALERYRKSSGKEVPNVYVMPHGMLDPYFQRAKGRKMKAIRNWAYWKLVESKLVNNAAGILFTCKQECILANKPFAPYHPKRELIVGLGVAEPPEFSHTMANAFHRLCPELKQGSYILFLGRVDPKKGVDMLLSAYEKLLVERIGMEVRQRALTVEMYAYEDQKQGGEYPKLVIAGPGMSTSYGKALQKMVEGSPFLKHHVFFPGMLEADEKWGAFYGCEAFILPSHQENFGIAVVEALACGKPVLISKQVNIFAEITQANAGIVGDDTIAGTHHALKTWVSLPEMQRTRMQVQARRCFASHFATGTVIRRLVNAIAYKNKHN